MKRGEIWTIAGGPDYTGKPRPALILQDDAYSRTESLTLCPITSDPDEDGPDLRIALVPTADNGLLSESRVMTDKVSTLPRRKIGRRIGALRADEMADVELAVMIFLGLAR